MSLSASSFHNQGKKSSQGQKSYPVERRKLWKRQAALPRAVPYAGTHINFCKNPFAQILAFQLGKARSFKCLPACSGWKGFPRFITSKEGIHFRSSWMLALLMLNLADR
jgi:hypothetical protein